MAWSRKRKLAIGLVPVLVVGLAAIALHHQPLPEIKSVAAKSAYTWHMFEGTSPVYESIGYEVLNAKPDDIDQTVRAEMKLPEGRRSWTMKSPPYITISHFEHLPKDVSSISVENGFLSSERSNTRVEVTRQLNLLESLMFNLTHTQMRKTHYLLASGQLPPDMRP